MDRQAPEPEDTRLTSGEFVARLRSECRKEIWREHSRLVFGRDPARYRRMGLNEYMEKDAESAEEIVAPAMDRGEVAALAREAGVSARVDGVNKDPGIVILLVKGTRTAVRSFREALEHIHNRLPGGIQVEGEVRVLDIPAGMDDVAVGRNGTNIYKLQRDFKVIVRVIDGDGSRPKALVVSGDDADRVHEACKHVIGMVHRDAN